MKLRCFLSIILLSFPALHEPASGQTTEKGLTASVDRRYEILSIAARLAEYPEYCPVVNKSYTADIHAHFDRYKEHPFVVFMRACQFRYHRIPALAVHLGQPPGLHLTVPSLKPFMDGQGEDKLARKFEKLLCAFYKDARCEEFLEKQSKRYAYAEQAFNKALETFDTDWFQAYFGTTAPDRFHVLIGLGNGGNNYATAVGDADGSRTVFAVMGTGAFDETGNPVYNSGMFATLAHEFNHSFADPLVNRHEEAMKQGAQQIYNEVAREMKAQAYGAPSYMLKESLVRACTIRYLADHGAQPEGLAFSDLRRNFLWIEKLSDLLGTYERERDTYPTLGSFMPKIVRFFNEDVAGNIDKWPHVTRIDEFENGDGQVDPGLKTITVHFDKPLRGQGYSASYGPLGPEHYPWSGFGGYSDDNRTITIRIDLKPNFEYQLTLLPFAFKTPDGWPIKSHLIRFKTAKETAGRKK